MYKCKYFTIQGFEKVVIIKSIKDSSPETDFGMRMLLVFFWALRFTERIFLGGDVVLQCRDEGTARARVKWRKERGYIKEGSTDVRGRLEMFHVTVSVLMNIN